MVDAVSNNGVTGAISGLAGGTGTTQVNFDTFLKLLVAQLKNQDPLNPIQGTEFTSQIAQFSQLEQQINGNSYLQELLKQRDYGQQTLATSYIGKEVLVPGDKFSKAASGDTTFGYSLDKAARDVSVDIINANGDVVKSFKGDPAKGRHLVTWDGKTEAGDTLPAGTYSIKINAFDQDGKKVVSEAYSFGKVDSVLSDDGGTYLSLIDGRQVAMDDVMSVQNPTVVASNGTGTGTGGDSGGSGDGADSGGDD